MGCGVACAASLINKTYQETVHLFAGGAIKQRTSGFYNADFVQALAKVGYSVKGYSAQEWGSRRIKPGTIVFAARGKQYPDGHFLLKTNKGWMDPWKTGDSIKTARAGWRKRFPGTKEWFIETEKISV